MLRHTSAVISAGFVPSAADLVDLVAKALFLGTINTFKFVTN